MSADDARRAPSKPFEIPDLDLPGAPARTPTPDARAAQQRPSPKPKAPTRTPTPAPGQSSTLDYFGGGSFEPEDLGSAKLDVDDGTGAVAESATDVQAYFGGASTFEADELGADIDVDGGAELGVAPRGALASPSAHTSQPTSAALGASAKLGRLPPWGAPPEGILQAPLYAWRVYAGRRTLRARVAELTRSLEAAELERDRALAALVDHVRPMLEQSERFASLLAPVVALERAAGEQQQALSAARAQQAEQAASLEAKLAPARQNLSELRTAEGELSAALARADEAAERADAKHKRALIELRNAGGPSSAPAQAQELIAKAAALEGERDAAVRARDEARARHAAASRAKSEAEHLLARLEAEQSALAGSAGKTVAERANDAGRADRERVAALAVVGREVTASRLCREERLLADVQRCEEGVRHAAEEHESELHAFDACDENAVKRGYVITAALLGFLLLALILAFR